MEREGIGEENVQETIKEVETRIKETLGKMEEERGGGRNMKKRVVDSGTRSARRKRDWLGER